MRWKRGCIALALLCCYYTTLRPTPLAVATPGPLPLRGTPPPRQPRREDFPAAPATRIAVCAASKSKPTWRSLNDTALATLLIPSLERTTRGEPYTFILYLAFDHDDAFWREHAAGLAYPAHAIKYDFYTTPTHKIPFNKLTNHAYTDGADYIVRINDDTEFVTEGWATIGIEALAAFTPANVGVVGPTFKEGNTAILTHDMVHRTHIDIFKYYYPPVFSAWWIDDWITRVYEPGRMRKLSTWHVAHHVTKHGTRYAVQHHESKHLKAEIERGRKVLREWVGTRRRAIDVVFLWVNGSAHAKSSGNDPSRVRDWGELRVSVPLAHRNVQPLGRIFVVTAGERPWYAHEMPYVHWISQAEFMAQERLPTFNSRSIQFSFLDLVTLKSLSDPFLLMDDDFFVRSPLNWKSYAKQHYLSEDGHDWVKLPPSQRQFVRAIQRTNGELGQYYGKKFKPKNTMAHVPFTVRHAALSYALKHFNVNGSYTTYRDPSNLQFQYLLANIDHMTSGVPLVKAGTMVTFVMRSDDVKQTNTSLQKACSSSSPFFCVNDDVKHPTPMQQQMMTTFLACLRLPTLVIMGTARDVGAAVEGATALVGRIKQKFTLLRVIVYENDSADDTLARLRTWDGAQIISERGVKGSRTERLAHGRNRLWEAVRSMPERPEYVLMLDLDGVNNNLTGVETCMGLPEGWTGCCANQRTTYYDLWALRTYDNWVDCDVWYECTANRNRRFRHIESTAAPIKVRSCFGGATLYNYANVLQNATYAGTAGGHDQCEHVKFHESAEMYIQPTMLNDAPREHIPQRHNYA